MESHLRSVSLHLSIRKSLRLYAMQGTQSQCHCDPLALKTNAPGSVVFDIFRAYFRQFQMEEKKDWLEQLPDCFAKQYLSQPAEGEVG